MTKVTVLMSTYNGEKYLKQQIDSIINQVDVEVNLIVRDDGSKDNTINILKDYAKEKKIKWYTGPNLKPALSFIDLVFNAPKSDYYAFSDQDDVWYPNKMIEAIKKIEGNSSQPALYYGSQELVDKELNTIEIHALDVKRSPFARFIINQAAGCTMVFNYNLFKIVKKHRPTILHMHDNWILKVCEAIGGYVYVDNKPYVKYRQHSNNVEGLNSNLIGKIKRSLRIMNKGEIYSTIDHFYSLYNEEMQKEYKKLCEEIIVYKKSIKYKFKLLTNKKIKYNNTGLRLTFIVMILFNKL